MLLLLVTPAWRPVCADASAQERVQLLERKLLHLRTWMAQVQATLERTNKEPVQNARRLFVGGLPDTFNQVRQPRPRRAPCITATAAGACVRAAASGRQQQCRQAAEPRRVRQQRPKHTLPTRLPAAACLPACLRACTLQHPKHRNTAGGAGVAPLPGDLVVRRRHRARPAGRALPPDGRGDRQGMRVH